MRFATKQDLIAVLMTAGSEKLQSYFKWSFQLEDGESKMIPHYWQDVDTDAETNASFNPDAEFAANQINWKSRCAGGYYKMDIYNEDTNGVVLGLVDVHLTKNNISEWPSSKFGNKASVLTENLYNELKSDDKTRQFVPHVRYLAIPPKQLHHEEGILETGKKSNPITTPFLKSTMMFMDTTLTSAKVTVDITQDFYEYSPGVTTSTRRTTENTPETDPD